MLGVSICVRFIANSAIVSKHTSRAGATFAFCHRWITGGRSTVSFLCFLFILVFYVWDTIGSLARSVQVNDVFTEVMVTGSPYDRLQLGAYMYKEPWHNMYIV